ncbi:MAG: hypothetical protein ACKV19_09010 [Verrucomicrobiales bacterium]
MISRYFSVILPVLALTSGAGLWAAQVEIAKNSVRTSANTKLAAGTAISPGEAFTTGKNSRTQLALGQRGSIMRAGSKTEAVLQNETTLSLRQGIMLASSGRGTFGREGVSVDTSEARTTVKGTMLVAYQPETYIKVTCIEGQVTVRLKALMGEFVSLREGQMVIINPAEKRLPESVEVDLRELIRTSALIGAEFPPLAVAPRLDRATERQAKVVDRGDVVATPLVLTGAGLTVSLDANTGLSRQPERATPPEAPSAPSPAPPPAPEEPSFRPPPDDSGTGPEYIIDGTTEFFNVDGPQLQTEGFPVVQGIPDNSLETTVWSFSDLDPGRAPELLMRGEVFLPATSSDLDAYLAVGELQVGDGSPTTIEHDGSLILSASGPLSVDGADIVNAGDGAPSLTLVSGSSVRLAQATIEQRADVEITAPTIDVQQSRVLTSSGPITMLASPGGGGITIANSSELHSMASSIGIALISQGGPVAVRDSQLTASDIHLEAAGTTGQGVVELRNAVLNGDIVRARGFGGGEGTDALIVNGSRVNASQMIKFYAEGASRLRFQGNVELNLSSANAQAILAGRTVQVDEGGSVRLRGSGQVFRDVDNYNKTGFGTLNATGQLTELPYDRRPPF